MTLPPCCIHVRHDKSNYAMFLNSGAHHGRLAAYLVQSASEVKTCYLHVTNVAWANRAVQSEAYELIKDWSLDEHSYLREHIPKTGLQTPFRDGTLQDVALKVRISWQALILAGFLERVWST